MGWAAEQKKGPGLAVASGGPEPGGEQAQRPTSFPALASGRLLLTSLGQ